MIDNDTAARIADRMSYVLVQELTAEGFRLPSRPIDSLQDVIYWLLRTETIKERT